jgi:uncharacterized protein DUF1629
MDFFVLNVRHKSVGSATTDYLDCDPVNLGAAPRCDACGRYIGMRSWLPPYRVELKVWGKQFGDLVSGTSLDLLISHRFKSVYEELGLTGLEGFDPVEVVRVKRRKRFAGDPPPYYRVGVVRTNAAIDVVQSGLEGEHAVSCLVCLNVGLVKRFRRVAIVEKSWTGEDIFIARGLTGTIITTERFKAFCDENRISNAVLVPANEHSIDFYPWERKELERLI